MEKPAEGGPEVEIVLDRESSVPIYLQIVRQVRDLIITGKLEVGRLLPPERRLAAALGVNRSTVLSAYRELKKDGFVASHVGRGTTVLSQSLPHDKTGEEPTLPWRHLFRRGAAQTFDPLLRDLLELTERENVIPLAIGLPAPEHVPVSIYRELIAEVTAEVGPSLLLHSPTDGVGSLREALSEWMARLSIDCDPSEILVLSGSQQGLDIATRVFLDPGDIVIVEEPSYVGALQAFRTAQARMIGVPVDENGMRVDVLAAILEHHRPKLIYTLPTFQNPSGAVMSLERRRQLLRLAYRYQIPILEDDPYAELRYDGDPVPSLKALDRHGLVIYLSTISKILFPGLRVGWLIAPRPARRQFSLAKQTMDLHSTTAGQWVLERFLRKGYFDEHLRQVRETYARRRDIMHAALNRRAPAGMTCNKPEGGFYIWCRLPEATDRSQLLSRAVETGVSFLPGWCCFAEESEHSFLRLNFSFPRGDQIRLGISRLLTAVRHSSRPARTARWDEMGSRPIV